MTNLVDEMRRIVEDALLSSEWTSASPGHTNIVKKIQFSYEPQLGDALDETIGDSQFGKDSKSTRETVEGYKRGNVDKISKYSEEQINNLSNFVRDPFSFVTTTFARGLTRGVGVFALLVAIAKLVETIIKELMEPGRPFDVRFREIAQDEILKFTDAREQAQIRQGFRQIIITSIGGLRGGSAEGLIGGNFYTPNRLPKDRIDPRTVTIIESSSSSIGLRKHFGKRGLRP